MSIDRLGPSASLLAALRSQATTRRTGKTAVTPDTSDVVQDPSPRNAAVLRQELKDIVRGVALDDEQAVKQVRTRVVRAVLLWQFGAKLREYSEWQPMLETLVATLEANEEHRQSFERLVRELSGSA